MPVKRSEITIAGCPIEVHEAGEGAPLLFLHPGGGFKADDAYLGLIGKGRRLICPSHPGFGGSSLSDWMDSVDDIAHIYLELMDRLGIAKTDLIGCSIGGWIAAEMATKTPERFGKITFVAPVGIKTGPADQLDIPDIFVMPPAEVPKIMFHDPSKFVSDFSKMPDEALATMVRNRESLALFVWEPYMHNPKLKHRLQRITNPVLFLRGASDGLVSANYLAAYSALVGGSRIETIPEAGHAPQLEQPQAFADAVNAFLAA
jgi:pimeloyl-ACP methyl ester carboxylesterase